MSRNVALRILGEDEMRKAAPSIFAEKPAPGVSDKYTFIPTTRVLSTLKQEGWHPVKVMQSMARTEDGKEYAKHVVRLRQESALNNYFMDVGDSLPELVLTNSHNRTSAYQIWLGIFRLICSNGLIVADSTIGKQTVRHTGYSDDRIIDATQTILKDAPRIVDNIAKFRAVQLAPEEREVFAKSALGLKYDAPELAPIQPRQLLQPRRFDDNKTDLWTTFNVVQENMLRGGLSGRTRSLRRTRTREVKSVGENMRLNRALWQLAEEMKKLKGE